jgi:hypothetical protein
MVTGAAVVVQWAPLLEQLGQEQQVQPIKGTRVARDTEEHRVRLIKEEVVAVLVVLVQTRL